MMNPKYSKNPTSSKTFCDELDFGSLRDPRHYGIIQLVHMQNFLKNFHFLPPDRNNRIVSRKILHTYYMNDPYAYVFLGQWN